MNTTLKTLDLRGNLLGNDGALALAEGLRVNTGLDTVLLTHSNIGEEGIASLAAMFTTNMRLTSWGLPGPLPDLMAKNSNQQLILQVQVPEAPPTTQISRRILLCVAIFLVLLVRRLLYCRVRPTPHVAFFPQEWAFRLPKHYAMKICCFGF